MKNKSLYPLTLRIWHWMNALVFVMLIVTGIQLRAPFVSIFSEYATAVAVHSYTARACVIAYLFWLFYMIFTGRIKSYFPNGKDIRMLPRQISYYTFNIFRGRENPFDHSGREKFNVLQKLTYSLVMFVLVPVIIFTGILFGNILGFSSLIFAIGGLRSLDAIHVISAYLFVLFLLIHMYMATIGSTVTYYMKKMILGD